MTSNKIKAYLMKLTVTRHGHQTTLTLTDQKKQRTKRPPSTLLKISNPISNLETTTKAPVTCKLD